MDLHLIGGQFVDGAGPEGFCWCGFRFEARQMREMLLWLTPSFLASNLVLHYMRPFGLIRRVPG